MELVVTKGLVSIEKIRSRIFYLSASFTVVGEILDLLIENNPSQVIISRFVTIAILSTILILRYINKINNTFANFVGVYTLMINVYFSLYSFIHTELFFSYFIRISVLSLAVIVYAGFNINKYHCIVLGVNHMINYVVIAFLYQNEYLIKGTGIIFVILLAFVFGIYRILDSLILGVRYQERLLEKTKKANEQLIKNETALKEANNSKDTLFSIISHDLKNPFSNIMGFAELLEYAVKENDQQKIIKYQKRIKQSSQITSYLLKNLFDWASTQREEIKYTPVDFELKPILAKIIEVNANIIERKNINIQIQIETGFQIYADPNMVESIFRNLISNAIKFTPVDGIITIGIKNDKNRHVFFVRDSGDGISKNKLDHLFSGKIQKSTRGTMNEPGSGLGLSICKGFVEKHQGEIWAELNPDTGLTMNFYLNKPAHNYIT